VYFFDAGLRLFRHCDAWQVDAVHPVAGQVYVWPELEPELDPALEPELEPEPLWP
jgi:hypothetical protein